MGQSSWAHKVYGGVQLIRACKDWPKWLREYTGGGANDGVERYRMRGGALLYTRRNGSDLHMIDEIWAFRKYDYFGYRVRPGEVVVDVGANIGTFTVYAATVCKAARVIAFEPFGENFAMLKKNVEANDLNMVTCVNEAVAAVRGVARFHVDPGDQGSHSLVVGNAGNCINVQCCTLQDVFERYALPRIDYLKMDCEGAEYQIFLNAPRKTLRQLRRISMEYHQHPTHSVADLQALLQSEGFLVQLSDGHRLYARRSD